MVHEVELNLLHEAEEFSTSAVVAFEDVLRTQMVEDNWVCSSAIRNYAHSIDLAVECVGELIAELERDEAPPLPQRPLARVAHELAGKFNDADRAAQRCIYIAELISKARKEMPAAQQDDRVQRNFVTVTWNFVQLAHDHLLAATKHLRYAIAMFEPPAAG